MSYLIFEPENSEIVCELAPTPENPRNSEGDFLRLRDGRILFAFSYFKNGGGDHDTCEIRCLWSDDEGVTFHTGENDGGQPHLLLSAERFGERNVMSVTLLRLGNGDAGLICILKHNDLWDECLLLRSDDEFETFYETVSILPGDFKGYYVLNNSRVIRLSDGRLLAPVSRHATSFRDGGPLDASGSVWFFASDDDGRTWCRIGGELTVPHYDYSKYGFQEPGVIELPGGAVYCYIRTLLGFQYEAVSVDRGEHWFGPQPSRFSAPVSPMKIAKNPYTGKYYAVWNPIPLYLGRESYPAAWGRTPLAIAESTDGYNFDLAHMQNIEDDPKKGYCYPSLFFPDADTLLVSYFGGSADGKPGEYRLTIRRIKLNGSK